MAAFVDVVSFNAPPIVVAAAAGAQRPSRFNR
jgi:hypothetical protein